MDIRSTILWWAADRRLSADKPFVIAVTGSIAKTSIKEAIGAILRQAYGDEQVRVGFGNLNTYLGLPLAILGYQIDFYKQAISWQWPFLLLGAILKSFTTRLPKYLVLEMGADRPGDLQLLTNHVKPDIGILTIVGEAHMVNYPTIEALANEKGIIVEATKPQGVVIINRNDPFFSTHIGRAKAHVVDFNCPTADIAHTVAELVGKQLGVSAAIIGKALTSAWQPEGRLQVAEGRFHLINDAYNASPTSMRAALEKLQQRSGRKIAVLGSMLELGEKEVEYHQEIGRLAHQAADVVVGVGELAKHYQPDAWYATSDEAAREIFAYLQEGASILVKGSHGVHMEKIVEAVKQ